MENEKFKNNKFYTLLDSDLKFLDFQFKVGLNIQEKFYPPSNMEKNRIVFVSGENIMTLFSAMINKGSITKRFYGDLIATKYIAELIIPFNNPDFQYIENYFFLCANMAYLGKYYPIDSLSTYENLISTGSKIRIDDIVKIADAIKSKSLLEDISKNYSTNKNILLFATLLKCDYDDIIEDIIKKNINHADTVARYSCKYPTKVYFIDKLINVYGVDHNILVSGAVSFENIKLLEYLISKGIDTEKAFYIACDNGKFASIKYLIDQGINPLAQLSKFKSIPNKTGNDKSAILKLEKYLNIEENVENTFEYRKLDVTQIRDQIIKLKKQVEFLESLVYNI